MKTFLILFYLININMIKANDESSIISIREEIRKKASTGDIQNFIKYIKTSIEQLNLDKDEVKNKELFKKLANALIIKDSFFDNSILIDLILKSNYRECNYILHILTENVNTEDICHVIDMAYIDSNSLISQLCMSLSKMGNLKSFNAAILNIICLVIEFTSLQNINLLEDAIRSINNIKIIKDIKFYNNLNKLLNLIESIKEKKIKIKEDKRLADEFKKLAEEQRELFASFSNYHPMQEEDRKSKRTLDDSDDDKSDTDDRISYLLENLDLRPNKKLKENASTHDYLSCTDLERNTVDDIYKAMEICEDISIKSFIQTNEVETIMKIIEFVIKHEKE